MNHNSPEIQKFLASAKEEIKRSGETCDIISFEDFWTEKYGADDTNFNSRAFLGDMTAFLNHNQVSYYKELTSYRKGVSVLVLPVKKVIRKIAAFLFLPLVAEQNEVNLSVARLFTHMRSFVNKNNSARADLSMREKEMEQQIRSQRDMINELTMQINELSKRLSSLENGGDRR